MLCAISSAMVRNMEPFPMRSACFCAVLVAMAGIAEGAGSAQENEHVNRSYYAHGILMWAAFGLLFPAGMLVAKYGQQRFLFWFYYHKALQVNGVLSVGVAMLLALTAEGGSGKGGDTHVAVGFVAIAILVTTVILGIIRPKKGGSWRPYWYLSHWFLGMALIVSGCFNIFEGLKIVSAKRIFHILFAVQVGYLIFLYLLLDRWQHFLSQSSTVEDSIDQITSVDKV